MQSRIPPTEARNPRTTDLDRWPSEHVIRAILAEDARGVAAAEAAADALAAAVEAALLRLTRGGRVHAFGAGASGRLAVLDATEATPTFGAPAGLFSAHFPGGAAAFADSSIDLEDAEQLGRETAARALAPADIAIGITASGSTAYVAGALAAARAAGALTILICCDPGTPLALLVDHVVVADTGAEAITGSTRLKAGTATKVLLNAFSTTLMVRAGRTYSNLMVDLVATNVKLRERAIGIVAAAAEVDRAEAEALLERADGAVPLAIVHARSGRNLDVCRRAISGGGGVRAALARLGAGA
ncbi:N-acetylmuramic acid 6-phosphate etherase [Agromyces silvae]|uniref:N-acetylmuramic acid 6-phosphate etherase n=1 Tax=Agromyces silvae TaxID=3388266 RepID=UPI00280ACD2C|nr:N-acetylmuramic acid 6-phosphate etherase [Agromyces protaetiae]